MVPQKSDKSVLHKSGPDAPAKDDKLVPQISVADASNPTTKQLKS